MADHTGRCACGAVAFRARGEPSLAACCHCADCRKATGAPFSLWVGFPADAVAMAGEPARRRGATDAVARGFCAACGSPILYEDATIAGPAEVHLAIGLFDAPERIRPEAHAFWPDRLHGIAVADGLARFEAFSRRRLPPGVPTHHVPTSDPDVE